MQATNARLPARRPRSPIAARPRTRAEPSRQQCDAATALRRATCWSSAAASTAPASPATSPGRGCRASCCARRTTSRTHTSSSSTKLIHGGLRYLEYYEFSLVAKALAEREVLLKSAPHIMWPLRFVMPHDPSMRPVWMIRIGLFLYDHLARREVLPALAHGRPAPAIRPARR